MTMKCSVCGSELPENSKFCVFCGSTVKTAAPEAPAYVPPAAPSYAPPAYNPPSYSAPAQQPTYNSQSYQQPSYTTPPAAPAAYAGEEVVVPAKPVKKGKKAKKSKKGLAIVAVIAAVLAVVVTVGLVILNMPSVKVPLALSRSFNAYAGIADDMGLTDVFTLVEEEQAYDVSLALTYKKINEMIAEQAPSVFAEMKGTGIRLQESVSLKDRRLSATVALTHNGSDLVTADLGVDDNVAWVSVPALLKNKYGVDTETLGKDLIDIGAMENEDSFDRFGFNLFELMDLLMTAEPDEKITKEFLEAADALAKEIEIEADGSKDIKVNGDRISCSKYNVTVPQDALENYLDAIEDPLNDYFDQIIDIYVELFRSIGVPEEGVEELIEELSYSLDVSAMTDSLKDALEYIEDVELELYIKGGYVRAAIYELEVDGETMVVTLNLGGDGKYVDDLSLTVELEDYFNLELSSSGNHSGKGSEYSDETELSVEVDGESFSVTSESTYAPKKDKDNFSWELVVNGGEYGVSAGIEANGQLTVDKKSLHLQLDELSVSAMGMDIITLGLDYSIGEYTGAKDSSGVKYIFDLTEDEMMALSEEVMTNGEALVEELMEKLPVLAAVYGSYSDEVTVAPTPVETYPAEESYNG